MLLLGFLAGLTCLPRRLQLRGHRGSLGLAPDVTLFRRLRSEGSRFRRLRFEEINDLLEAADLILYSGENGVCIHFLFYRGGAGKRVEALTAYF